MLEEGIRQKGAKGCVQALLLILVSAVELEAGVCVYICFSGCMTLKVRDPANTNCPLKICIFHSRVSVQFKKFIMNRFHCSMYCVE